MRFRFEVAVDCFNWNQLIHYFFFFQCCQIRNPDMSWKEAKRTLRKDARSEVTEILQKDEKEKMFTEHIEKLTMKKKSKFR